MAATVDQENLSNLGSGPMRPRNAPHNHDCTTASVHTHLERLHGAIVKQQQVQVLRESVEQTLHCRRRPHT